MTKRPPQKCKIIDVDGLQLEDGTELKPGDVLEWRGEITIRYSEDLDNLYTLYGKGSFIKLELGFFDMIGHLDKPHYLSDLARCGAVKL